VVLNHNLIALMQHRRRSEKEQPETMMSLADLVVGEQINFGIVQWDQWQITSGDTQFQRFGKLRREFPHVRFEFSLRDISRGIGVHDPSFAGGPLFKKRQVQREINVVRVDCQMNCVLDVGAENVMGLRQRRKADGDESTQEPSRTNSLPPGR
jgi:hypothetical protein